MLTDKQKNKIFNRNFQAIHSGENLIPDYEKFRDEILDYLKKNKDNIIESSCLYNEEGDENKEYNHFEMSLHAQMQKHIDTYVKSTLLPDHEKQKRIEDNTEENFVKALDNLLEKIRKKEFVWYDGENLEWGGAGVIITSDRHRPAGENDIFICVSNPNPIVSVFCEVKELGNDYIDYGNKHGIYEVLAKSAQRHIEDHNNESEDYNVITYKMVKDLKDFLKKDAIIS
ncbi:MAG: hypothetical protein ACOCW8_02670 [bacterium]